MRAVALVLALVAPAPVTSIGASPNADGSNTIFWTLPADPTVVGVTVFRDRLDVFEPEVRFDLGIDTSLTDFGAVLTGDYRYWVHTRDGSGDLSVGTSVDVIGSGSSTTTFVSSDSGFICWAAASPAAYAWPLVLAVALLALSFRKCSR